MEIRNIEQARELIQTRDELLSDLKCLDKLGRNVNGHEICFKYLEGYKDVLRKYIKDCIAVVEANIKEL